MFRLLLPLLIASYIAEHVKKIARNDVTHQVDSMVLVPGFHMEWFKYSGIYLPGGSIRSRKPLSRNCPLA